MADTEHRSGGPTPDQAAPSGLPERVVPAGRRRPLIAGGWARRIDDVPYDESLVRLVAVEVLANGAEIWTVRAPGTKEVKLLAGYLQAVPGEFAP